MKRCFMLGMLLVIALPFAVYAQVSGQVRGGVVDQTDSPIPGATVSLRLPDGDRAVFSVATNSEGLFNVASVPAAFYDVVVEAKGFQMQILRAVKVDSGRDTVLPVIKLQVQAVVQTVDIVANPFVVETSNAV